MIVEEGPNRDYLDDDTINKYLNAELILSVGMNNERWGHVIKQSKGLDGKPVGCAPTLNLQIQDRIYRWNDQEVSG